MFVYHKYSRELAETLRETASYRKIGHVTAVTNQGHRAWPNKIIIQAEKAGDEKPLQFC